MAGSLGAAPAQARVCGIHLLPVQGHQGSALPSGNLFYILYRTRDGLLLRIWISLKSWKDTMYEKNLGKHFFELQKKVVGTFCIGNNFTDRQCRLQRYSYRSVSKIQLNTENSFLNKQLFFRHLLIAEKPCACENTTKAETCLLEDERCWYGYKYVQLKLNYAYAGWKKGAESSAEACQSNLWLRSGEGNFRKLPRRRNSGDVVIKRLTMSLVLKGSRWGTRTYKPQHPFHSDQLFTDDISVNYGTGSVSPRIRYFLHVCTYH